MSLAEGGGTQVHGEGSGWLVGGSVWVSPHSPSCSWASQQVLEAGWLGAAIIRYFANINDCFPPDSSPVLLP